MNESEMEAQEALEQAEEMPQAGAARSARVKQERPKRRGRGYRRVCVLCAERRALDYKDVAFLRRFLSDRGRIETRRRSNCCAKHQRILAQAIKRARHLALLPYTPEHIRAAGAGRSR